MKKTTAFVIALTLIASFTCCTALAESVNPRAIILMTEYQQMGWGEVLQFGALDADGTLWVYGSTSREDVPY